MGSCLSKKSPNARTPSLVLSQTEPVNTIPQVEKKKLQEEPFKKEIFIIKHRKSNELERRQERETGVSVKNLNEGVDSAKNGKTSFNNVRTSSCTKEEVDAILIQCGRLSRSSSARKVGLSGSGGACESNSGSSNKGNMRFSGSKRSFDFDSENVKGGEVSEENEDDCAGGDRMNGRRHRHRSRTPISPGGRRRTPSREREQGQLQPRSGSRERCVNGSGRRVSRSPGRRSESPNSSSNDAGNGNGNCSSNCSKPQKMVSVPATVSSLAMDKSINGDGGEGVSAGGVKRIQVRRNVGGGGDAASCGGTRTAASPRAWSPARSVQNQQPLSLSRSDSRNHEQSPFRRNPLSDIDTNVVLEKMPVPGFKTSSNSVMSQISAQKWNGDSEAKLPTNVNVVMNERLKPQEVAKSRSSRLSRDLDINPEALTNANPSYTSLLLEDIQNFHQKNTGPVPAVTLPVPIQNFHQTNNSPVPVVTLPACVTKAHSILEALADLNSSTGSNLSSAFSENRRRNPLEYNHHSKEANSNGMRKLETKTSFVKSQVVVADNDLMQPSFHKYVTVRRGTLEGGELEEQESSGSNSLVGGSQQHWVSSSSWEPTSADSTDRWTSRSTKEDEFNPLGFQRQTVSDIGYEANDRRRVVVKRNDGDLQQNGIGRGRVGPRGQYTMPTGATASS